MTGKNEMLKPVYLRNRDIQSKKGSQITDFDLVGAVGAKITDIKCIQRDRDLWRIYVDSRESRNLLVSEGFELRNRSISVFDTNPFSAGTEKPDEEVLRVTVKGVPLSVEDSCIVSMLQKLGAKLTSDVKYEKIRNPTTKKMTEILNGNRFMYIKPLSAGTFLPRSSFCAGLKCAIIHKGQPISKRSMLCTNCWGDDHLRYQCEYETCCKVCKESGHEPGSTQCEKYDGKQKDILAFSGKDEILSNFYPCEINIFGMNHNSAEHAFQYSKAMRSGDVIRAAAIRDATTALDAKRIGSQITVGDQWTNTKKEVMSDILDAKFEQVSDFKKKVLKIGKNTTVVEAAFDDFWGSGLNKQGTLKTAIKYWPGQNVLGQMIVDLAKANRGKPHTRSSEAQDNSK